MAEADIMRVDMANKSNSDSEDFKDNNIIMIAETRPIKQFYLYSNQ